MTIAVGKTVNPNLIALPIRDIHVDPNGMINHLDLLNFLTQVASVTPRYQEGSFTATLHGFTTNLQGTMTYRIVGNLAFISMDSSIIGTSNSAAFTITGAPSILRPIKTPIIAPVAFRNNGVDATGRIDIAAGSSTWTCSPNYTVGSAWAGAGSTGIVGQTFCFMLD